MILKIVAILCSSTLLQGSQELIPQPTTSVKKDITQDFCNLNEDLQTYILQYLEPDPEQFKTYLDDVQGSTEKITHDLCGEFFYNFAMNYETCKRTGKYKQRSQLCTIRNEHGLSLLAKIIEVDARDSDDKLIIDTEPVIDDNNTLMKLALDVGADPNGKYTLHSLLYELVRKPILFLHLTNRAIRSIHEHRDLQMILLLEHGANPNDSCNNKDALPLSIVAYHKDQKRAQLLLNFGADTHLFDSYCNCMPFDATDDPELKSFLKNYYKTKTWTIFNKFWVK